MRLEPQSKIIDITGIAKHQKYLHRCLAGPFRQYKKRTEYLKKAIPKGFHKKLLIFKENIVGQIEYSPAKVSYYPIVGDKIIVMNCIWVLKKARGHNFGKQLLDDMIRSEKNTTGFATIALEGHWSPWFKKSEMEQLGFKPLDSIEVVHKTKHKGRFFRIYLMWMPITKDATPPVWNQQILLEGITSCILHPLYRPQTYEQEQIFQRHQDAREKS
jgi:L-amino acid N-acyltransferase YncA